MSACAFLRSIIVDRETDARLKLQAAGLLEILNAVGIDDMSDALLLVMGMMAEQGAAVERMRVEVDKLTARIKELGHAIGT